LAFAEESPVNPVVEESGIPIPNHGNGQVVLDTNIVYIDLLLRCL
jgi:hypothetical protein